LSGHFCTENRQFLEVAHGDDWPKNLKDFRRIKKDNKMRGKSEGRPAMAREKEGEQQRQQ
jgi:hypothetical protein